MGVKILKEDQWSKEVGLGPYDPEHPVRATNTYGFTDNTLYFEWTGGAQFKCVTACGLLKINYEVSTVMYFVNKGDWVIWRE